MNLSLIMVVGTLFSLIVMFEQQYFSSFNQSLILRKNYLQNFYPLLDQFVENKDSICANKSKSRALYSDFLSKQDLKHGFYCHKVSLFYKFKRGFLVTEEEKRINLTNLSLFNTMSYDLNIASSDRDPKFLIIDGVDSWELNHTFYGLIWVKNDLIITGTGGIKGQIISDAQVDYSAIRTRVRYIRKYLTKLDNQYSFMEYKERSWRDFYN